MENTYENSNMAIMEDHDIAAKNRFDSFKLGKGLPSTHAPSNNSHRRSHSRSSSISSSLSRLSLPVAPVDLSPTNTSPVPAGGTKRNSHHRRRSSVSTRAESADMMGVEIPDLPLSESNTNINLGEIDSIRRRALWALEGKPDVSYVKVEIPELASPEDMKIVDPPIKPSYSSGGGFNGSKRDSFKQFAQSASSNYALNTLVEEEEEEEEEEEDSFVSPVTVEVTKPTPARPRPAQLNLRPLSLTPDSVGNGFGGLNGLPTPTESPSATSISSRIKGLRRLSLTPSPTHVQSFLGSNADDSFSQVTPTFSRHAQPLILTPSPTPPSGVRRSPLNNLADSPSPLTTEEKKPRRRSSISYKTSNESPAGLPTPNMTPILSERRFSHLSVSSISTDSDDFHDMHRRPLSVSEQHFLFKSHNALLARITDLERTLSSRPHSRPVSCASDVSSIPDTPNDEMIQMLVDLKAERDELKRDVDGWRMRVGDMEKQVGVFAKRVEAERRDAWVARSRAGLLDVEKTAMEKVLNDKITVAQEALEKCELLKAKCVDFEAALDRMRLEVERSQARELELKAALEEEQQKRQELELALEQAQSVPTPTARTFDTKVSGDDQEEHGYEDGEDEVLAAYSDVDLSFESPGSNNSSVSSFSQFDIESSRHSLSKTWTFPNNFKANPFSEKRPTEVDHFFVCLGDDTDSSSASSSPVTPSYEESKGLFSRALNATIEDDDDMPPFFVPSNIGTLVEPEPKLLEAVLEEEEEFEEESEESEEEESFEVDDYGREVEAGGIKIIFTPPPQSEKVSFVDNYPPQASLLSEAMSYDHFEDEGEEDDIPTTFNFGRPVAPSTPKSKTDGVTRTPSPSSIPRRTSLMKSSTGPASTVSSPPSRLPTFRFGAPASNAFVTPPPKRVSMAPSFIPQPVAFPQSSSPTRSAMSPELTPRKASFPTVSPPANANQPTAYFRRYPPPTEASTSTATVLKTAPTALPTQPELPSSSSFSSFVSSPFSSRLASFASPLSWAANQVAPAAVAAFTLISDGTSSWDEHPAPILQPDQKREVRFISRERQLERLRSSLHCKPSHTPICGSCRDQSVFVL